jgi:hypothetical protein
VVKTSGSSLAPRVIREYSATVGATDGNIIAAIMTTQTPTNQPNVPRPVQGPSSMPRICSPVHHQPTAASANRTARSPSWVRAAASAGRRPASAAERADRLLVIASGGPREVRLRQPGLSVVLDAERVDA